MAALLSALEEILDFLAPVRIIWLFFAYKSQNKRGTGELPLGVFFKNRAQHC